MAISEYGRAVRKYRGKGHLVLADGSKFTCHVSILQVETGNIYLICKLAPNFLQAASTINDIIHHKCEIDHVQGKTVDGLDFTTMHKLAVIHASLQLFSNKTSELTLMADEVSLIVENEAMADYYDFGVVNFEFSGNHNATKIIQNGSKPVEHSYLNLEMKAPWGVATVDPLPDYDEIIKRIKVQKGTSITCKFIVKSSRGIEADEIINNLDELCRLLSLSQATKITWINALGYTATGKIKEIILKNSIT